MAKGKKLTKEEELLLQDYSRDVSSKSLLVFYGNAALVSILPLYLFTRIHLLEMSLSSVLLLLIVSVTSTWLVSSAYKDNKFVLKHKIAQKKGHTVASEVSDYEAMTMSIFHTNAMFLASCVILSSFIIGPLTANPGTNYALSILGSAGLASLHK